MIQIFKKKNAMCLLHRKFSFVQEFPLKKSQYVVFTHSWIYMSESPIRFWRGGGGTSFSVGTLKKLFHPKWQHDVKATFCFSIFDSRSSLTLKYKRCSLLNVTRCRLFISSLLTYKSCIQDLWRPERGVCKIPPAPQARLLPHRDLTFPTPGRGHQLPHKLVSFHTEI